MSQRGRNTPLSDSDARRVSLTDRTRKAHSPALPPDVFYRPCRDARVFSHHFPALRTGLLSLSALWLLFSFFRGYPSLDPVFPCQGQLSTYFPGSLCQRRLQDAKR